MEIILPVGFSENLKRSMGRAGYSVHFDQRSGNSSYVKRLSRDFYPRFHVYLKQLNNQQVLNLHLDQKKSSYAGTHAHGGEYDGELVKAEASRLEQLLVVADSGRLPEITVERKSFWSNLFRK
ncbi:MAG: hypothetical protein PHW95_04500 [Patescibacteria group bacterium]|nr:hypothetical protein [Patescibacteria group bacterium]